MIFPFASCLPTGRKMEGANAKLFAFCGHYKHDSSLLFFCSVHYFSRELFFFFKTARVIQVILSLKSVKNKNLWQYDMNINFLIN